ncbi:MAG: hypothetical protein HYU29_06630 [Chloroflexi bacterium]|nr:hypothetical protein [Chloroflexota bacterium]
MGISRRRAWAYAEQVLARPGRHIRVTLRHGKQGVTLLHKGRSLTRCHPTRSGLKCAEFVAEALGVELPPAGASVDATVTSGVLFRALSISSLDLRRPVSYMLLERLLQEAELQRIRGAEGSLNEQGRPTKDGTIEPEDTAGGGS